MAAWLAWLGVTLVFVGLDYLREPDKSFIQSLAGIGQQSTWRRLAESVGPTVAAWFPVANMESLRRKLIWAGEPYGVTPEGFIGLKVLALAGGTAAGGLLSAAGLPSVFIPAFAVLAYLTPDYLLSGMVEQRKNAIYRDLPDMVGLLATAVKAGVELGPALETVGKTVPGPLGEELRKVWRETATGRPRAAALKAMAQRTGVPAVERFVETVITAEERGGMNVSDALAVFMRELRASQSRKAQEQARKIPTKMLLPLVLCIFLPMLALLITPVAFMVLKAL